MNFFDRDITDSFYKCIEHIFLKLFFAYLVNLILTIWKFFLAYHTGGNILSRGGGDYKSKTFNGGSTNACVFNKCSDMSMKV